MLSYDPDRDAYAILGVSPEAKAADIERAYRRAALMWHPDKTPAPDAAERFHDVQQAGRVLRDAVRRREYDHLRRLHLGPRIPRKKPSPREPQPYVPMRQAPPWLAHRVKIHRDAVLFTVQVSRPPTTTTQYLNVFACGMLGGAVALGDLVIAALAIVVWAIGRVVLKAPHKGSLVWAKIVPGRRLAEYHALDQGSHHYDRLNVPFAALSIAMVAKAGSFKIEIQGFPRAVAPVLFRTRNRELAQRCAREAGDWLRIPIKPAA